MFLYKALVSETLKIMKREPHKDPSRMQTNETLIKPSTRYSDTLHCL